MLIGMYRSGCLSGMGWSAYGKATKALGFFVMRQEEGRPL